MTRSYAIYTILKAKSKAARCLRVSGKLLNYFCGILREKADEILLDFICSVGKRSETQNKFVNLRLKVVEYGTTAKIYLAY